jgi:pimeloyl-ACP methyl ester carboxylesterase
MGIEPVNDIAPEPERIVFTGADGNQLVADAYGSGPLVLLLHGGGQTRHSWTATAQSIAAGGQTAIAVDLRGHGDSDWSADRAYPLNRYALDVLAICSALPHPPALIGASMGGIASLLAISQTGDGGKKLARCLALVDVATRLEWAGVARIRDFMLSAPNGFASIDEAAAAVTAYLPSRPDTNPPDPRRPAPKSNPGLIKNLRQGSDGRYRWHWDPQIMDDMPTDAAGRTRLHEELVAAARTVDIPTLLVRGQLSDVVSADGARDLQQLILHAEVAEVVNAGHMVAGDDNVTFAGAIISFTRQHSIS